VVRLSFFRLSFPIQLASLSTVFILLVGGCGEVNVSVVDGCENCTADRCLKESDGNKGRCVECIKDAACRSDTTSTNKCLSNQCVCGTDTDCADAQVCSGDATKGKGGCVDCVKDDDCKEDTKPYCVYNTCTACKSKQIRSCEPIDEKACKKGKQTCKNSGDWGECEGYVLCNAGEKCVDEECVPDCPTPAPCDTEENTCTTQATELPGKFKVCKKNSKGCFELSDEKSCKLGEYCANGQCVPFTCPTPECQLDETRCVNESEFRICEKDVNGCLGWSDKKTCESGKKCRLSTNRCVLCDPGSKQSCYTAPDETKNKGICRIGEQTCTADGSKWGDCVGQVLPAPEQCNGQDDDCNGKIDDNLTPEPCGNQTGSCKGAVKRCGGAKGWITCEDGDYRKIFKEYEAQETLCDGLDNNCDGQADNSLVPKPCKKSDGVCKGTFEICDGKNGWIACTDKTYTTKDARYEATESKCDGADNDCDGQVDENFPTLGNGCTVGLGECKNTGKVVCKADGSGVECNVKPKAKVAELCNGKDDDCDGGIDESLKRPCFTGSTGCTKNANGTYSCKGICKSGTQTCNAGKWGGCQNQQTHKGEISCNGQDDDCDGRTDEVGCQKGYGCSAGICKLCTQPGPWRCKKFLGVCTKSAKCTQSCKCGYTCRCTDGATFTSCAKAECKP